MSPSAVAETQIRGAHTRKEFVSRLAFSAFSSPRPAFIGRFLADPLEGVPTEVIDFLTGQLGVAIPPV